MDVSEVLSVVDGYVGEFHDPGHGSKLYASLWVGPLGAAVESGFRRSRDDHVRVSLPGEVCERLGLVDLVALLTVLGGKPTRWDLAVDGAPFHPKAVYDAWQRGMVRSKLQRDDPNAVRLMENGEGTTVYMGSEHSDRMLRIYNRRGPTRVEMQLRRAMAEAFWARLQASTAEDFGQLVMSLVAGFVDFAAPSGSDSNRSRWLRLPWWSAFMGTTTALVGLVRRAPSTWRGLSGHVRRNASALVTWLQGVHTLGGDMTGALDELLQQGRARQGARHRAMVSGLVGVSG